MVKPGDTVRYLNDVGGGKVVRVDGKIAYVDDDGFETPFQVSELVVVVPAGHIPEGPAKLMFDQKAFDIGKTNVREKTQPKQPAKDPIAAIQLPVEEEFPIEETEYGDNMTIVLAFEPEDVKKLSATKINTVLVNDSNYFLNYQFLIRDDASHQWKLMAHGEAAPNELVDLAVYTQESIKELERIVFQAIAYKKDKSFDVKYPLNVSKKIDLTKFYKMHTFRRGVYFDTPVIELPLYADQVRKNRK